MKMPGWLSVILMLFCTASHAEQPDDNSFSYQLGVGAGYSRLPDYPGADSYQHYLVPFPYFTYRSNRLEVNRSGALGKLAEAGPWSLNVSLAAALPASSKDNQARQGMPDLLWLTEVGPTLDYQILDNADSSLSLHLPLRKAIATNLRQWQDAGWRFEPHVRLQKNLAAHLNWTSQLGLNWSSQHYHQYLYGVDSLYVTEHRPYFRPAAGYAGWRWSNGLSWQRQQWWLGTFIRYDNLKHTQFNDSPLLQRQHSLTFGFAIAWIFKQQGDFNE